MLSISSCRAMRPRPAPIADRIAISRLRFVERARSRFAAFAQAINRTSVTAPSRTSDDGRISRTSASRKGSATKIASGGMVLT
jgi:hypothetical protein